MTFFNFWLPAIAVVYGVAVAALGGFIGYALGFRRGLNYEEAQNYALRQAARKWEDRE